VNSQLNSRSFGLALVAVAWALFLAVIGSPEVILFTVPVFILVAPLALGKYLGEEMIASLAGRVVPRRQRPSRSGGARIHAPATLLRGALLIASNLAGRAPPLAST